MPTYCPSCGMNVETDLDTSQGSRQWRCGNCKMVLKQEAAPQPAAKGPAQPVAKVGVTKVPASEVAKPPPPPPPIQIKPRSAPPAGREAPVPLWQQGGGIDLDDAEDGELEIERGGFSPGGQKAPAPAPEQPVRRPAPTPRAAPAPAQPQASKPAPAPAQPQASKPAPAPAQPQASKPAAGQISFGGGDIDFGEESDAPFEEAPAPAAPASGVTFGGGDIDFGEDESAEPFGEAPAPAPAPAARAAQAPAQKAPPTGRGAPAVTSGVTFGGGDIDFGDDEPPPDFEPAPTRTFVGRIPTRENPNAGAAPAAAPTARAPSAAAMAALAAMKGGSVPAPAPAPPPPVTQPLFENVVICDDSALLREILKDALEQGRVCRKVICCANGEEFVQTMTEQLKSGLLVDLAILDVEMPVLNGFYGAIALRAIERAFRITMPTPLLFFSGRPCDETFKRVLDYTKPARYLNKGVEGGTPQRIAARLAQVLATLRQQQA